MISKHDGKELQMQEEMQKHMDTLLGGIFEAPTVKKSAPAPKTRTADAVIGDFLSSMGLK